MAQTISKEEMDALREAVKNGDISAENQPANPPDHVKVLAYNFRKPQIISADEVHKIRGIQETFANRFAHELTRRLRKQVEIKVVAVDQTTYNEAVALLANPTYIAVLGTKPNAASKQNFGNIEVELNLGVATSLIDILLGGDGGRSFSNRALTSMESAILNEVKEFLCAALKNAWSSLADMDFAVLQESSVPGHIQAASPETLRFITTLDIRIDKTTGALNICYPITFIQAVLEKNKEQTEKEGTKSREMLAALNDVPVEIRATLGTTTISARQLASLKAGDIVTMDKRISTPVEMHIDNRVFYYAELGQHQKKTAVRLTGAANVKTAKKE